MAIASIIKSANAILDFLKINADEVQGKWPKL